MSHMDSLGCTALHHACRRGHLEVMHWLLEEGGASPNVQNLHLGNGYTPLMDAVVENRTALLDLMLTPAPGPSHATTVRYKYKVNVNLQSNAGFTALMIAAKRVLINSLEVLVQRHSGAHLDAVDHSGWTALHHACAMKVTAVESDHWISWIRQAINDWY